MYKITQSFLKLCVLNVLLITSLNAYAAEAQSITLKIKGQTLQQVFNRIIEQYPFVITYDAEQVDDALIVNADIKNADIEECMDQILVNTNYRHKIIDNHVIILKKPNVVIQDEPIKIKGVIRDIDNEVIVGANIITEDNRGTISDVNGVFELTIDHLPATINITFIGYDKYTVFVEDTKDLEIILIPDINDLSEVVVTGYSNVDRKSFTGNAITVKKQELMKVSSTNVVQALQMFDPSLRIVENNEMGSDPNNLPEFYIRGKSGIGTTELDQLNKVNLQNNPNAPTFILNGFEVSMEKIFDLDINRIKNITILKDAAATAIYGSRAANGVVVVETAAPKAGQIKVNYILNCQITQPDLSDYNLMNAEEKLEAERLSGYYDSEDPLQQIIYQQEYDSKYRNIVRGIDTDWLAMPTQTSTNFMHSIYLEGGHDDLLFGVNLKRGDQNGVMKGSYRDTRGASINLTYNVKKLIFKNITDYTKVTSDESPYGAFQNYTYHNPYISTKDEFGNIPEKLESWRIESNIHNPALLTQLNSYNKRSYSEFKNNFSMIYNINNDFRLRTSLTLTEKYVQNDKFVDPNDARYSTYKGDQYFERGAKTVTDEKITSAGINLILTYNKNIKKNSINVSAGINGREYQTNKKTNSFRGFPTGNMDEISFASEYVGKGTGMSYKNRLLGSFLTCNYSYDNKYLLDISYRLDGSSSFGSEKKYAPFYSGGLGVNLNQFQFVKNLKFIDLAKIRATYGVTGKTNFSPNAANTMYKYNEENVYAGGLGVVMSALGNDYLKWEKTYMQDIGLEIGLFKRFNLRGSYYKKRTTDLVSSITVPATYGFKTYVGNTGEVLNQGYEFYLNAYIVKGQKFNLNAFGTIAHNENKMEKISDELREYNERLNNYYKDNSAFNSPLLRYQEGQSLTAVYAMQSLGINPMNGREIFLKKNGDVTYDWDANEQVVVGDTSPEIFGTFGFNASYKNWSLYTGFMYSCGAQIYNTTLVNKVEQANIRNNVDKRVLHERWKKPGDHAKYKSIAFNNEITRPTQRFVMDEDYLSLKSLTLSYELPNTICSKVGTDFIKLSFNTYDLFRLSTVKQERGLAYPFARSFNFSLNARF